MAAFTLLFLARRSYGWWALSAALALLTHYFAAFLLVPEALWLLWSTRRAKADAATRSARPPGSAPSPGSARSPGSGRSPGSAPSPALQGDSLSAPAES